jgi:hypothetical protein
VRRTWANWTAASFHHWIEREIPKAGTAAALKPNPRDTPSDRPTVDPTLRLTPWERVVPVEVPRAVPVVRAQLFVSAWETVWELECVVEAKLEWLDEVVTVRPTESAAETELPSDSVIASDSVTPWDVVVEDDEPDDDETDEKPPTDWAADQPLESTIDVVSAVPWLATSLTAWLSTVLVPWLVLAVLLQLAESDCVTVWASLCELP